MKQTLTIIKNVFALILLGGLALTMLTLGIGMLIENQTRDLSQTEKIVGAIKKTKVVREKSKVGAFPFRTTIEQDHLIVQLESGDLFGTFNPDHNYSSIQNMLTQGTEVTMYYYNSADPTPTNNIYQLELNGQILVDNKEYAKNHSIAAIAIIVFGLVCLGCEIWLLKTKKINKNWAQQHI